ncbi:unnamed protein product [Linum trigynum]|uniref:Uncharacterized protein n=2 Tax=Linum trigynum TaxID=586398 RepID=A0AAV2DP71_9ROSI
MIGLLTITDSKDTDMIWSRQSHINPIHLLKQNWNCLSLPSSRPAMSKPSSGSRQCCLQKASRSESVSDSFGSVDGVGRRPELLLPLAASVAILPHFSETGKLWSDFGCGFTGAAPLKRK